MKDFGTKMDAEVRYHEFVKEFQSVPQGDILLIRIPNKNEGRKALELEFRKNWPEFKLGAIGPITENLQLVNDDTMGARHCIAEADRSIVTIYSPGTDANPLEGPVIEASGRFTLTHPEHADHSLPEGTYQVTYQRDFAAEQLARVRD